MFLQAFFVTLLIAEWLIFSTPTKKKEKESIPRDAEDNV